MINREKFFSAIRKTLFNGTFSQEQVINIDAMLDEYERRMWKDIRWLAYILGTSYHETGLVKEKHLVRTMAPVEEMGKGSGHPYGKHLKFDGEVYKSPDHIYYGRGHTQNTWYETYDALTKKAKEQGKNWDFLNEPELLLQVEPSIWATFHAMSTGLYTGRKLSRYFNNTVQDFINARRIINGTDKAKEIAEYSMLFHAALK